MRAGAEAQVVLVAPVAEIVPRSATGPRVVRHLLAGQAMRRSWIAVPYGEEELTRLEEEVIPVLRSCVERIDEIDRELEEAQEAEWAIDQARMAEALVEEAGAG